MSLGTLWVPRRQDVLLCCGWVIACAGLEDDDCHHCLVAEPPCVCSRVDTCVALRYTYGMPFRSRANVWETLRSPPLQLHHLAPLLGLCESFCPPQGLILVWTPCLRLAACPGSIPKEQFFSGDPGALSWSSGQSQKSGAFCHHPACGDYILVHPPQMPGHSLPLQTCTHAGCLPACASCQNSLYSNFMLNKHTQSSYHGTFWP